MIKTFKNSIKKEIVRACILIDDKKEMSWCIYHSDDGGVKLIFSKSTKDFEKLEDFSGFTIEDIKESMINFGFDIEPQEEFGNVFEYVNYPEDFILKLVDLELVKAIKVKFEI